MTSDMRQRLEGIERQLPPLSFGEDDIHKRLARKQVRRRVAGGTVGVAVTIALIAGASMLGLGSETERSATILSELPPATTEVPIVAPGEFTFSAARLVGARRITMGPIAHDYVFSTVQTWRSSDASGRIVTLNDGQPKQEETYEEGQFPADEERPGLAELPTDPVELQQRLLGDVFEGSPVAAASASPGQSATSIRITRILGDILTSPILVPQQRVAAIELLSSLQGDGVDVQTGVTDPGGRPAHLVSFSTTSGPTRFEFYVDPASHDLLAALQLIPSTGQLLQGSVFDQMGVASSTDTADESWIPPIGQDLELPLEPASEVEVIVSEDAQGAVMTYAAQEQEGIATKSQPTGDPYDGRPLPDVSVDDFRILVSVPAGTPFSIRPFDELDGYTWAWSSVRPREGSEMVVPTDPGPRVFFLRISLRNGTEFDVAFGVDVQGVVHEASPW